MKTRLNLASLIAVFVIAGCDSDSNNFTPEPAPAPPPTTTIQVLHASPDASPVDILLDGTVVLQDVDYKTGSAGIVTDAGTYSVEVRVAGTTDAVIGPVDVAFRVDTTHTIAAVGSAANITATIVEQPRTDVSANSARVLVLHGASGAPEVDVYVTTPGAMLMGTAPTGTFEFEGTIGPAELAQGDYQIRVTAAGVMDPDNNVLFDSGTITLNDGDDFFITAVPNTAGGAAPISLVVQTGSGSLEILDVNTQAYLRVFHTSPDTPPVAIVANDDFMNPLVPNLAFPDFIGYVPVPAADYNVKVTPAPADMAGLIAIDADVSLAAGQAYDVLAVDTLAMVEALVLNDDPRPVATYAKVRIIHASPTAQDVDIYVMAPGTDINDVDPTLTNVAFKANTGYLAIAEGTYDIAVAPAGTKNAAIGPATFPAFNNGDVLTIVARDAAGGGLPLDVIVTSDSIMP